MRYVVQLWNHIAVNIKIRTLVGLIPDDPLIIISHTTIVSIPSNVII